MTVSMDVAIDRALIMRRNHDGNTCLIEALENSTVACVMTLLELEDVGSIASKDG
jgi:hypothetical protein